jgi:hypothetical protein
MTRVGGRAMVEKKQENRVDDHPNPRELMVVGQKIRRRLSKIRIKRVQAVMEGSTRSTISIYL